MIYIIDPQLIAVVDENGAQQLVDEAEVLTQILFDRESYIGSYSKSFVLDLFLSNGWPHNFDLGSSRDSGLLRQILDRILAKLPVKDGYTEETDFTYPSLHSNAVQSLLARDILGAWNSTSSPLGVLTRSTYWTTTNEYAFLETDNRDINAGFLLAKTDCSPMVFATTLKKFDFLASLRDVGITFIGGKRDPDVLKTLSSLLGVTPRDVRWIESEKNKSPTNIDATLPDKDSKRVVVMVTGAIGHSTSIPTKALAKKRNFRLIETEQARHTMVALQEFAG